MTRARDVSSTGKRRTASELAALSEQLFEVIAAHPRRGNDLPGSVVAISLLIAFGLWDE